jgi:hypothetical protein
MNVFRLSIWFVLTALMAVGTTAWSQQVAQQPAADQNGLEVLTRGPVHEAFAETITYDPDPGIVVPKAPPDPIEEIAPEQRPEGANVTWIPGYWGWDDERSDFLWVSGIWRALPPGRQWVPGYWGQSQQGFQWTSGYWADADANQIDYLPEPPATIEAGPNIAAPSADATWLPGSWIWQQNRYGWRAGYWTNGNQDWDWVPDHYVWTPRGYVYVDGYYDYSVPRRGIVFAPVYFNQGLRTQRGFSYSPSTVINPGVFVSHLFLRPSYGHYYFGDYYGANYASAGYSPWFSYQSSHRGYDPIYANQRWRHRDDRDWVQRARANFRNLRDNEDARPPRTWAAQTGLRGTLETSNTGNLTVAEPLDELTKRNDVGLRFRSVDPTERQQFGQRGQEYRKYLQQRQQLEAKAAGTPGADSANAPGFSRTPFSRSPFVALPADKLGKGDGPPQRHEVLKPNFQVQPQPRVHGSTPGARSGFGPGTKNGSAGQNQVGPQGQLQRQNMTQGNQQGALGGQSEGSHARRGNHSQGRSNVQQQGASTGQQQSGASGQQQSGAGGQKQGGANGQPQSAAGSQGSSPQPTPPASQGE